MGKITEIFKRTSESLEDELPEPYKPPERNCRIKMKISTHGSSCGTKTERFQQGETYQVSKALADAFVKLGVAEII